MGLSSKRHIREMLYLLSAHGIEEFVVCPGSRNMPIVESVCNSGLFEVHRALDERSGGFMALGMAENEIRREGKKRGRVAICVTSGSAVANLLPSVIEGMYRGVRLVIVSGDRPSEAIGQMLGQTMMQVDALKMAVKYSVEVREGESEDEKWFRNREINKAMYMMNKDGGGIVHLNVQITEPFFECEEEEIGEYRVIREIESEKELFEKSRKGLAIVGQGDGEDEEVLRLLQMPIGIYSEALGNVDIARKKLRERGVKIRSWEVEEEEVLNYNPDYVYYYGGHIVSKQVINAIKKIKPKVCIRASEDDGYEDTFRCMTHYKRLKGCEIEKEVYDDGREGCEDVRRSEYESGRYSEVYKEFLERLGEGCDVFVGNSSSVRAVNYAYQYCDEIRRKGCMRFHCNRGVNGIEGSMSAAIGYTLSNGSDVYLVIGDLSFLYDVSSLFAMDECKRLHVMLVNDQGGGIFGRLEGMRQNENVMRYIDEKHNIDVKGIAESYGVEYRCEEGNVGSETWTWFNEKCKEQSKILEIKI